MMLPNILSTAPRYMLLAIIAINLFSCGVTHPSHNMLYAPLSINSFFMTKKKETHLKAGWRGTLPDESTDEGSFGHGAEFSVGHAISDHVGVMATYSFAREKDSYNDEATVLLYRRNMVEVAAGYSTKLAQSTRLYFEVYGGYGYGNNKISDKYDAGAPGGLYKNKMHKFSIQPAFFLRMTEEFKMGLILKTSFLRYHNVVTQYTDEQLSWPNVKLYNADKHTYSYLEPCYTVSFPFTKNGWISGTGQIGGIIKIGGPNAFNRTAMFSMGLIVDAHKIPLRKPGSPR